MTKTYRLHKKQYVKANLDDVFRFFSRPENLQKITPPDLSFKILTPSPIEMKAGAVIDYQIKLGFIPLKWRTLIESYDPPHRFVDTQQKGPYAYWHHLHQFKQEGERVLLEDIVDYRLPFGLLGRMVHAISVKKQLEHIFNHRQKVIGDLFHQKKD